MSTFNDTRFEFDAEVERIENEIESLREEFTELADDESPSAGKVEELQDLQAHRKGAIWARDKAYESEDFPAWDEDVDGIRIGAPRAGLLGQLQNDLGGDPDAGEGTANTLIVADATVEAPYVGDDISKQQAAAAVGSFHPYYIKWAKARVDDLLDPESGNGTSSGTSSGGKRAETTSTDE